MAYTVEYLHDRFLDKLDKEGSDVINTEQLMELLRTETTSYVEGVFKYLEVNQQIRDSILPLSKPFLLNAVVNPTNNKEMIVALPSDYWHLETVDVIIPDVTVREVTVKRRGEILRNKNNPHKKPDAQYIVVIEYSNTIGILGSNKTVGVKAEGFYLSIPEYGDPENLSDIAVNLPDSTVEMILNKMVSSYLKQIGDPGFPQAIHQEQKFGQKLR